MSAPSFFPRLRPTTKNEAHFEAARASREHEPPPSSSLAEKNASAHFSSVRRRAISDARSLHHQRAARVGAGAGRTWLGGHDSTADPKGARGFAAC